MKALFDNLSLECSRLVTRRYSTSFTIGILCLQKELRNPVYSVYGFVRLADEIVDSFHRYNQHALLAKFRSDTKDAIEEQISLNPILNSFQATVHQFKFPAELTELFLRSMEMDLSITKYDDQGLKEYITGSAEAVGLMCLRIFCNGDDEAYHRLSHYAVRLGSAFQKINFLRDLKADTVGLGRTYFAGTDALTLDCVVKENIEESIEQELADALTGIKKLPPTARFGVYVAYMYYLALFKKIKNTPAGKVLQTRIRIPNPHKATLLAYSYVKHQLNMI